LRLEPAVPHRKEASLAIGPPGRRPDPINVIPMALALILAAFLGAALGLLWHAAGFGD